MNACELLEHLEGAGVRLRVVEGGLEVTAPKGFLDEPLTLQIRESKGKLIELLSGPGDPERHFVDLCSRLYEHVATPDGKGKLWQVFHHRVGVVLDGLSGRVTFYPPNEVEVNP